MGITILGNVGKIIEDNHGEMYFDNAKKVININGVEQTNPATQHAQHAEEVEEIVEDKTTPSFFRTDAQSITKIQAKWKEALGNTTKTAVIRFVKRYEYTDGYFKLVGTYEQLAVAFNEAQDKFVFTANDFENANKPLKK